MKTLKLLFIGAGLSLMLGLAGCASTPAKQRNFHDLGQFSVYPMNQQTYRITFKSDRDIRFGQAEEIALLKAAQTTIQQGFRYFKVLNDPSNLQQKPRREVIYTPPPIYYGGYYGRRHGGFFGPYFDLQFPYYYESDPVEVSYTIECYKNDKTMPADAFDALLIFQTLGQQYGLVKALTTPSGSAGTP